MDTLAGVSSTLLIPLYVRAQDAMQDNPILGDMKAIDIYYSLREKYDFSIFKGKKKSYYGILARATVMDREAKKFLMKYPNSIVISLGAGLDSRFYRIDQGKIEWYNVDFPEVIQLRERYFSPHERIHNIGRSLLDSDWVYEVKNKNKPILCMSEGVFMYFHIDEILALFRILQSAFSSYTIHIDLLSKYLVHKENIHDICKNMDTSFNWGSQTGKELVELVPHLKQVDLISFTPKLLAIGPWYWKLFAPIMYMINNRLGIYEYSTKN